MVWEDGGGDAPSYPIYTAGHSVEILGTRWEDEAPAELVGAKNGSARASPPDPGQPEPRINEKLLASTSPGANDG